MGYYAVGQCDLAIEAFKDFIQKFPNSPDAADAQFFIGESYYQQRQDARGARGLRPPSINTYKASPGACPTRTSSKAMCYEQLEPARRGDSRATS